MSTTRVMVVDDDNNICEFLRLYLEKEQLEVEICHDGQEALDKFQKFDPSIILLDVMMPKLDGWQVCREIRKVSQTPIIMIVLNSSLILPHHTSIVCSLLHIEVDV